MVAKKNNFSLLVGVLIVVIVSSMLINYLRINVNNNNGLNIFNMNSNIEGFKEGSDNMSDEARKAKENALANAALD
jgi:hypothetical protein